MICTYCKKEYKTGDMNNHFYTEGDGLYCMTRIRKSKQGNIIE